MPEKIDPFQPGCAGEGVVGTTTTRSAYSASGQARIRILYALWRFPMRIILSHHGDQQRYGEVDTIAEWWTSVISGMPVIRLPVARAAGWSDSESPTG